MDEIEVSLEPKGKTLAFGRRIALAVQAGKNMLRNAAGNALWLANPARIKAVYETDIVNLTALVPEGSKCFHCGLPVTQENLGGWVKSGGDFVPFCDSLGCVQGLGMETNERE